jgi:hypothetical protein
VDVYESNKIAFFGFVFFVSVSQVLLASPAVRLSHAAQYLKHVVLEVVGDPGTPSFYAVAHLHGLPHDGVTEADRV